MHSHNRRRRSLGRWLATGAAVLAVALPVAATASASSPPSEPSGASEPSADDTTAGGSDAAGADCASVFAVDAAPGSDAPADDTATVDTPAAADTMAATADTTATADSTADSAAGESDVMTAGPVVQTAETALGTILVDAECRALYAFTADVDGESTCVDGCAAAWPPLLVEGEAVPELATGLDPALFAVVEHPLGPMLKAGDFPLYYFASDVAPGDIHGQGVNGVWFVVAPDGTLIEATDTAGAEGSAPTDSAAAATVAAGPDSEPKATDAGY